MEDEFTWGTGTGKEPEILIMGTPVAPGNRGVMALGASLVDLCLQVMPGSRTSFLQRHRPWPDVKVLTEKGQVSVQVITCQLNPKVPLHENFAWIVLLSFVYRLLPPLRERIRSRVPWIRSVANAFLVGDVRGGDSFSDIYGFKRFFEASLLVYSCILVRGSIVHFPQTYGPFKSPLAKWIAKRVLRRSSMIYARDPKSQAIAQELIGNKLSVGLSPDVAFALVPQRVPNPVLNNDAQAKSFDPASTIGINVNGLMYHGGYTGTNEFGLKLDYPRFLRELIPRLLEETSGDILLVPHTYAVPSDVESDNAACESVRESLPEALRKRVRIVIGEYDAHELKGIIGSLDFFIGSRMHSCIAALSQGIPCVGVAYSMKFAGVFESVGAGDLVIDGRAAETAEAIAAVLEVHSRRDPIRQALKPRAMQAKRDLYSIFLSLQRNENTLATGVADGREQEEIADLG